VHLPQRERAFTHLVAAVRPGGWLLVEDYDLRTASAFHPTSDVQARAAAAVDEVFAAAGADPRYGIKLAAAVHALGWPNTRVEARLEVVPFGSPSAEALALKLEQFASELAATGLVSVEEVRRAAGEARTAGAAVHYPPLMVSARAQRPGKNETLNVTSRRSCSPRI
jgi:hypothetical protein